MAVDTSAKRYSMLNFSWVPGTLVFEPDGTVDADDRMTLLHMYGGAFDAGAGSAWALYSWLARRSDPTRRR